MAVFFETFLWCLIGLAAFFAAVLATAILWHIIIPILAFYIVKIFNAIDKLSDKLYEKIKK